jgi:L-ascorbate metabolism protein UlaG (beta-lactamase superfamily)
MSFRMRWLGTACFEIVLPNQQTVVIDPYVDDSVSAPISSNQFEGCNYIFITHGHYDHVLDAGKLALHFKPKIFCNEATASSLIHHQRVNPGLITPVKAGDNIQEKGLGIEVVRGIHVDIAAEFRRLTGRELFDGGTDLMSIVRKGLWEILDTDWVPEQFGEWVAKYPQGEQLNFIFEMAGSKRIYMAGTYPDPSVIEMAKQAKAYITLLQVLPGRILYGLEEKTADLAIASGCQIVVPQHHDPLVRGAMRTDLSRLRKILTEKSDIIFQEFTPGEWYKFD